MRPTHLLLLLASLAATACAPKPPAADLIVDTCAMAEYREECEMTISSQEGSPADLAACMVKARSEALRIRAGVPAGCR